MNARKEKSLRFLGWLLFILYLFLLAYFLFFSEAYGRMAGTEEYRYNLRLFQEIRRFIRYREELGIFSFLVNVFGNVLAFAPFGFCLPLINKRENRLLRVLFLTMAFSLMIETLQLVYRVGIFDVDDVFLNTVGGVLGLAFYRLCVGILRRLGVKRDNASDA